MTVLTTRRRKAMPQSDFALPGRRFPMNDATHARMAISGATRAERAGNITESQEERIQAAARKKLGIKAKGPDRSDRR